MRRRAYRPELPGDLEDRALLSSVVGLSAHPVVLSHRRFDFIELHMRQGFDLFGRHHDIGQVSSEIADVIVMIPFEHVDGLDVTLNRIVDRMRQNFSAHVPHAVRSALKDVLAATRAEVQARVQSGDVVVR